MFTGSPGFVFATVADLSFVGAFAGVGVAVFY